MVYDAADRLVETILPDATPDTDADNPRTRNEYDDAGRKTAEVDERGRRKELAYDGLGRLVAVTLPNPATGLIDSGALVTRYGYDEVGNKLTQTDALGRITRWTYDAMGRELTRMLPLGQVEAFAYDDAGQRVVHRDFKGVITRYGYDAAGRMDVIDYATDADVFTTYTASGQRESVADGQGTTLYTYTARDQLASVATPDGNTITYAYDAAGNKTELHSAALDQAFDYDDLNRLENVDSRTLAGAARRNHFEYDEVGNRKRRVAADDTTTMYGYDVRNRLRTLAM
jgi:YD repeat-containing protein